MISDPERPKKIEPNDPAGSPGDLAGVTDLRGLPKEMGYVLLSAGVLGFVLPGPGTPALIAGGMVLWPERFGKAEAWFKRRYPSVHRDGMRHVHRFLKDLESRYPGSSSSVKTDDAGPGVSSGPV
jgi:hypothetical protein